MIQKKASQKYLFSFRLNLGPCELPQGCYAADFKFEFVPRVGLSSINVEGGIPESQIYTLVESSSAELAFELESSENQIDHFSCTESSSNNLSQSSIGQFVNWFNIVMLFVVVLRCLVYRGRTTFL